ncbi:MAG: transglycosylase SLT domain-containing protein [Gemmatimonadaceae bacterium]
MRRLLLLTVLSVVACNASATNEVSDGVLDLPVTGDSLLASAAAALEAGEPWRATQLLNPALRDTAQRTPARVLLAARAAAAWEGWSRVEELLGRVPWLDSEFDGMGRELLARAAIAHRADTLAIEHARHALTAAATASDRGRRRVIMARVFDRMEMLDSAAVAYAEGASLIKDAEDWLRLRAASVTADSARRAAHFEEVELATAKARVRWVDAQARERTGDIPGAVRAYQALGAHPAALRLAIASGDSMAKDSARRELVQIIASRRGSNDARTAIEVIDASQLPLTPADELSIARSAAVTGPMSRAIEGFNRAFRGGQGTSRDRYSYASLLARAGRDRDAVTQYARVPKSSPVAGRAAYERGRTLLRSGDGTRARAALEAVVRDHPKDSSAASSALYLLADIATDNDDDAKARAFFRRVVAKYPRSGLAASAGFRAAIISFVNGDARATAVELDTLSRKYARNDDGLAMIYWGGRAWERAGDSAAARARWMEVVTKGPLSYYAMLAAKRLGHSTWSPAPAGGAPPSDSTMLAALRRAELLEELGLGAEADREYDWVVTEAERSIEASAAAAHAFHKRGLTPRAIRLANRALWGGAPRDEHLFRVLYPVAYETTLTREAARHDLDHALVAALIRQESNFEPRATSAAGARGLMQIMPSVGRQLASAANYPIWDVALLYQPDVSIELGTTHLAGLLGGYEDVTHALAAYNAGSSRAKRWLRKPGTDDPEVFVERIPYAETRGYVRVVLRNRELYRTLYEWPATASE